LQIAYPIRVDALRKSGGDLLLMQRYIQQCGEAFARRGLPFRGEILAELEPDLSGFDVVHLTNLDRPFDLYLQFLAAKRAGKRIVLTPLHHSYDEIGLYEKKGRGGLIGLVSGLLGFYRLEALRILLKSRTYPALRKALVVTLRKGIRAAQIEVLKGSDSVLVAANKEWADIEREICPLARERVVHLRNGFEMPDTEPVASSERDITICVAGRIEARKNQITILRAMESVGLSAVFIGNENPNHKGYCNAFRRMIENSRSTLIEGMPLQELYKMLARSRVHVAASWFEVSSLLDVEAYVLGCRTVASRNGGTRELLGDDAYYVDPSSMTSIATQIQAALDSSLKGVSNSLDFKSGALETWEQIAETLSSVYLGES
jgi:glycosyltransferase involved in cell wall biosynthesis